MISSILVQVFHRTMPERSQCRVFNPLSWFGDDSRGEMPRLLVIGCGPAGIQSLRIEILDDFV